MQFQYPPSFINTFCYTTDRYTQIVFSHSHTHSLSIGSVVDSHTLQEINLHMLQIAATAAATAALPLAFHLALTNIAAAVGCLA